MQERDPAPLVAAEEIYKRLMIVFGVLWFGFFAAMMVFDDGFSLQYLMRPQDWVGMSRLSQPAAIVRALSAYALLLLPVWLYFAPNILRGLFAIAKVIVDWIAFGNAGRRRSKGDRDAQGK